MQTRAILIMLYPKPALITIQTNKTNTTNKHIQPSKVQPAKVIKTNKNTTLEVSRRKISRWINKLMIAMVIQTPILSACMEIMTMLKRCLWMKWLGEVRIKNLMRVPTFSTLMLQQLKSLPKNLHSLISEVNPRSKKRRPDLISTSVLANLRLNSQTY